MKKILIASSLLTAVGLTPALAQHHGQGPGHGHQAAHGQHHQYSGTQHREIKALSAQQMEGLRGGKGMGMAMPAELNGYPGPLHVLELASQIGLSSEQHAQTKKLYAEMLEAAKAQGEQVIAAERELDALFAQKKASLDNVSSAVTIAAAAQAKLRETHLRYHLSMMNVLTPEQVAVYNRLRGY
jgi:Spy/CpxP family protein refolding chaperone